MESILATMPIIITKLKLITRQKNVNVNIGSNKEFSTLPPKIKIVFLLDILSLLHPLTHQELIWILKEVYGDYSFDINVEISLLIALSLIEKIDDCYVRVCGDYGMFIKFYGVNEISLRANIINYYHKYSKYKSSILKKKIKL